MPEISRPEHVGISGWIRKYNWPKGGWSSFEDLHEKTVWVHHCWHTKKGLIYRGHIWDYRGWSNTPHNMECCKLWHTVHNCIRFYHWIQLFGSYAQMNHSHWLSVLLQKPHCSPILSQGTPDTRLLTQTPSQWPNCPHRNTHPQCGTWPTIHISLYINSFNTTNNNTSWSFNHAPRSSSQSRVSLYSSAGEDRKSVV